MAKMGNTEGNEMSWYDQIDSEVADAVVRLRAHIGDDRVFERDFRPDIKVDPENLVEQLSETPTMYAFWSSVLAEQKVYVLQLEKAIKRRKAIIVNELVEQSKIMKAQGVGLAVHGGLRKDDIKELLEYDDKLLELDAKYLMSVRVESKIWGVVNGLKMKMEALRTICALRRAEMEMT